MLAQPGKGLRNSGLDPINGFTSLRMRGLAAPANGRFKESGHRCGKRSDEIRRGSKDETVVPALSVTATERLDRLPMLGLVLDVRREAEHALPLLAEIARSLQNLEDQLVLAVSRERDGLENGRLSGREMATPFIAMPFIPSTPSSAPRSCRIRSSRLRSMPQKPWPPVVVTVPR